MVVIIQLFKTRNTSYKLGCSNDNKSQIFVNYGI